MANQSSSAASSLVRKMLQSNTAALRPHLTASAQNDLDKLR